MTACLYTGIVAGDLQSLVLGEQLGAGATRAVYQWLPDDSLVAKIEERQFDWHNIAELQVWQAVRFTNLAKWFAPCIEIAGNGSVLLQRRTQPIRRDELPAKVPAFFTDLKPSNWGLLDGRPVCHDYGLHLLMEKGMGQGARLAKAHWND